MSSFENEMTKKEEEQGGEKEERREEEVAPFVTKLGAVTVTHFKQSSEPPTDFQFCQPCTDVPPPDNGNDSESDEGEKEEAEDLPPVERNICPKDVVSISDDDDTVFIVGTQGNKVTRLSNMENMTKLEVLTCRSCLIGSMDGLVENHGTLRKLELYDNHIQKFSNLEYLKNLVILDMSYNAIRDMKPVEACVHLEELYLAQNKLRRIQGLEKMHKLRTLDLGANRIRVIDAVTMLTSLKSLWLGKNKIEEVPDLSALQQLRQLDVQSNRLTILGTGLQNLTQLEELFLACNNLHSLEGLPRCTDDSTSPLLNTLDLTTNKIQKVEPVSHLLALEELWMSENQISFLDDLAPLQALPALSCLYLERSPIQTSLRRSYRDDILAMLPNLTQLDASLVSSGRGGVAQR